MKYLSDSETQWAHFMLDEQFITSHYAKCDFAGYFQGFLDLDRAWVHDIYYSKELPVFTCPCAVTL